MTSLVARSLKLSKATSTSVSIWMGDWPGRPSAVNLCRCGPLPVTDRQYSRHRADTDVELIKSNQAKFMITSSRSTYVPFRHIDRPSTWSDCNVFTAVLRAARSPRIGSKL